jgi:hypothetical protein
MIFLSVQIYTERQMKGYWIVERDITHGVDFINILCSAFMRTKDCHDLTVFLHMWDLHVNNQGC